MGILLAMALRFILNKGAIMNQFETISKISQGYDKIFKFETDKGSTWFSHKNEFHEGDRVRLTPFMGSVKAELVGPNLAEIRLMESFDALKPAIRFLCAKMKQMGYGEFIAYKRTLEAQAEKVGASIKALNEYAEQIQVFGYEIKESN